MAESRPPGEGRTPREWDDVAVMRAWDAAGSKVGLSRTERRPRPRLLRAFVAELLPSAPEGAAGLVQRLVGGEFDEITARAVHAASDDVMPFEPFEIPAGLGGRERRRREKREEERRAPYFETGRAVLAALAEALPAAAPEGEGAREAWRLSVLCPRCRGHGATKADATAGGTCPACRGLGFGGQTLEAVERWLSERRAVRGEVERSHRLLDSVDVPRTTEPVTDDPSPIGLDARVDLLVAEYIERAAPPAPEAREGDDA